ncbi:hypothetical protein SLA2020_369780 [Shorea laevis]
MHLKDFGSFCFLAGVKAQLPERTPSFNDLNALLYGQEHLGRDDLAFIFSLKVIFIFDSEQLVFLNVKDCQIEIG